LFTCDIRHTKNVTIAIFADDIAIPTTGESIEISTKKLQFAIEKGNNWTKKWKVK